ncbi:unnamed protein product [Lymnaea stagnalis]|uniref:Nucleolar protein 6 n=1 Tax=Lymnaea stagnalis TaxID=6523 RepID=A0AAV2HRM4_LYMST
MKRKLSETDVVEQDPAGDDEQGKTKSAEVSLKESKKAKHKDHDFSSQEIARLKETEALFHSSLFRLQVSELLKEVSVKQKLKSRIEEATEALIETIKKLPAGKECKITERQWLEARGFKLPVTERPFQVKGSFQFLPPTNLRLTGSALHDTLVKPDVQPDLVVQMPKACFQPKDYLNQRYTRKRALYLSAIALHLKDKKRVQDLKFTYLMGNPHKPVLLVTMKGQDSKSIKFNIHVEPEDDTFKLSRFHIAKNNLRPKWFFEKEESGSTEDDESSLPATPFYNSSILHDLSLRANNQFIEKMIQNSEGVRDGIMLLKVWLHQRELLRGIGAFSSYLITAYVVYLLMLKKINKLMNSYQVFRTTLLYLSKSDWTMEPPSFFEDKPGKMHPTVDEFRGEYGCIFIDRTGYYNMAYMMSPFVYGRVKDEATLSVAALDHHHQNCFSALFMTPVSFARKFDHIFHVTITPGLKESLSNKLKGFTHKEMDLGGHSTIFLSHHIPQLLMKALEKRVLLIQGMMSPCPEWSVSEAPYSHDSRTCLTFGINLNIAGAFNILDRGPPADFAEAKEFREFWGNISEMRRFKDGTIHEAVLWTNSTNQCDRRRICKKIVQHVLNRHCGIPKANVHYMEGKLDTLLHLKLAPKDSLQHYGTGEEQSLAVLQAFDQLNRAVRALTTMPLAIHSVTGIHPVFRHSDVFPPLPAQNVAEKTKVELGHVLSQEGKHLPQWLPALEVICMLEGSGKWPEEIEAIQCLKALFHIKMGNELKEKQFLPVSIRRTHVDVLKNGFVFRLKIANSRELAVLRTLKTESGMVKFKDTDESTALECEIVALPHLTNLLHGIQQENPAYSSTVRLCKRWIASQMIWDFLPEIVIELLVAHLFISPPPYSAPGSPCTGFMRFLHLLSTFNWKADPLMVNLNKEFTDEDFSIIPKEFTKNRATLPSMCIPIPTDKQGTKWTRPHPTEAFLQRVILLARESLKVLEAQLMTQWATTDFKLIFRPPLHHYDLLIRLIKKTIVVSHQAVDGKHEIQAPSSQEEEKSSHLPIPVIAFNPPLQFLQDLRNIFGEFAMFFYDPYGGDLIGLVWKSQALDKKDFKTSHFQYRKPSVDEKGTVTLEVAKECILDDIRVIGGGIVETIVCPKTL